MRRDRPPTSPGSKDTGRAARETLAEERRATAKTLRNVPQVVSLAPLRSSADRVVIKIAIGMAAIIGVLILAGLIQVAVQMVG